MPDLRRRQFITLLGGTAVAWPLATRAQQPVPVIGLLSSRSPDVDTPLIAIIRRGLNRCRRGSKCQPDGQYDRLPGLAADLVWQPERTAFSRAADAELMRRTT